MAWPAATSAPVPSSHGLCCVIRCVGTSQREGESGAGRAHVASQRPFLRDEPVPYPATSPTPGTSPFLSLCTHFLSPMTVSSPCDQAMTLHLPCSEHPQPLSWNTLTFHLQITPDTGCWPLPNHSPPKGPPRYVVLRVSPQSCPSPSVFLFCSVKAMANPGALSTSCWVCLSSACC